jgi:hypothetical protein
MNSDGDWRQRSAIVRLPRWLVGHVTYTRLMTGFHLTTQKGLHDMGEDGTGLVKRCFAWSASVHKL